MISLLVVATLGQYRQCVTRQTYQTAYAQPVYQQATTYNDQAYVEKTIFVAVENAQDYYGGLVGQQVRNEQRAAQGQRSQQELGAKVDRLSEIIQQLQRRIESTDPALPPKAVTPDLPSAGAYPASEAAPPPPTISSITSAHAQKATEILTRHCAKCHTGESSAGGGNAIFDRAGTLARLEPADLLLIDQAVYSGSMPKNGVPLTSEEYSAVRAWIDESRAEIASTLKQAKAKKS